MTIVSLRIVAVPTAGRVRSIGQVEAYGAIAIRTAVIAVAMASSMTLTAMVTSFVIAVVALLAMAPVERRNSLRFTIYSAATVAPSTLIANLPHRLIMRNRLFLFPLIFVLAFVSTNLKAQDIIIRFEVAGNVVAPVMVSTSIGTLAINGGETFYENIKVYSATDALGRTVITGGPKKFEYKTGEPSKYTYVFETLYTSSSSDESSQSVQENEPIPLEDSDYSSTRPSGGWKEEVATHAVATGVDALGHFANGFGNLVNENINVEAEGYPNVQLDFGLSRVYGEHVRFAAFLGGAAGFTIYGGVGKGWVFSGKNHGRLAWHAGLGYYVALGDDENQDFDFGISFAETPVVCGGALNLDLGYHYFLGRRKTFGFYGGLGLGVGNLKGFFRSTEDKVEGKFLWDVQLGIAIKLWQAKH